MAERNYRDAVHNMIRVDTGTADGDLAARLIDTAEFQRLRRIRQLGLAFFAYQTAEHSRFTHSLGAFHLAGRILDRLSAKRQIEAIDRTAVLAAALLHDVGHGPFSHVIESVLGFHHEDFTIEAVLSSETEIGETLRSFSKELPDDVAAIVRGEFRRFALAQLVSSQLDVDRMDYLLRDTLMTGVKYGIYDLEWVLRSIGIDEEGDQLYVTSRGIYAVEDYLQARYYMFRQVYFHRTLRAAEGLLRSILKRAIALFAEGRDVWFAKGTAFETVLAGRKLSLAEHMSLDDADILFHIKQWQRSDDTVLADLADRFLTRRLFKAMDIDADEASRTSFVTAARQAVEAAGYDPDYYFIEDSAGEAPHLFYANDAGKAKDRIYVAGSTSDRKIQEISEISPAVRGLQKGYQVHRICFPGDVRLAVEALR